MGLKTRNRRGQTAVMFTLAIIPLFGIVGLVVEVGWAFFRKEAAQTAADAAATAAGLAAYQSAGGGSTLCSTPHVSCYSTEYVCPATLPSVPDNNIQAGCMYARDNGFVTAGKQRVTIQSGVGHAPTSPGVTTSYWIVVRVTEQGPRLFSAVLGSGGLSVAARATTGVKDASAGGCVITLNPTAPGSISMVGVTSLQSGCGVFVNSNSGSAISLVGNASIDTTGSARTEIVGNCSGCGNIHPAPQVGVPAEGDPFAEMAPPTVGSCNVTGLSMGSHDTQTINPGVYCGGISLGSHAHLTLNPGFYIVKGGISLGGQSEISGTGVTIYIQSGGVSMAGGTAVNLTAPSSGDWQGILFYQDRSDTAPSTLVGGSLQAMNGVLYFPSANLTYTGGSSTNATATTIVADTLTMVGNSFISAAATTRFTGNTGGVALIE